MARRCRHQAAVGAVGPRLKPGQLAVHPTNSLPRLRIVAISRSGTPPRPASSAQRHSPPKKNPPGGAKRGKKGGPKKKGLALRRRRS